MQRRLFCADLVWLEADRVPLAVDVTNATILALSKGGTPIKQIVRQIGHSRKLVRQVIRGECTDVFRSKPKTLSAGGRISSRTKVKSGGAFTAEQEV